MSKEYIEKLKDEYMKCIEVSEADAEKNAAYIFNNLKVINQEGSVFMKDSLMPVVKIIEYIENEAMYEKFVAEKEELGEAPEWANDFDFGYNGLMVPYLSDVPEYKYSDISYAMVEVSDFKNQDEQYLIVEHKLFSVEDTLTSEVY